MRSLLAAMKGEAAPEIEVKPKALIAPAKKPINELSLIEEIETFYLGKKARKSLRPGMHPSEISYEDPFCPRWHFFRKKMVECSPFDEDHILHQSEGAGPDPSLYRIFDMGHSIHAMYQNNILGPSGVLYGHWNRWNKDNEKWETSVGFRPDGFDWEYVEPRVQSGAIRGHCDGIVKLDGRWFVLEIKSSNDQAFTFRKKVKREHLRQAMLYCHLGFIDFPDIDPEGIVFIYVNKNTSKEQEYIIPKDTSVIQDILDGLETYQKAENQQKLPDRCCLRANSKRANSCPAKDACFAIPSGNDGWVALESL